MIGFGLTNKGLVRKANEDNYLCCLRRNLFVVADGMGGHVAGEIASRLAIQTIDNRLQQLGDNVAEALQQAVLEANTTVYNHSVEDISCQGMGTTLTALVCTEKQAFISHVGDSRAYLMRQGKINMLTNDHSLVSELVDSGQISPQEAEKHPQKHMLTRALGTNPILEIDSLVYPVETDDVILLCTDGLSNLVDEDTILDVINSNTVEAGTNKLLELALAKGGHDNITIITVKV